VSEHKRQRTLGIVAAYMTDVLVSSFWSIKRNGLRSIDGRDRPVLVLYAKQPVVNVRQTVSLSNRGGVVSE